MIKKLLFCLCGFTALAQSPIPSFYSFGMWPSYTVVTSPSPLDQSGSGANVTWTFDQLVELGFSESQTVAPLPEEVATYPNTTLVNHTNNLTNSVSYINSIYFSEAAGVVSITGASNPDITLNLSADNATIGTFPMNFGDTNSDTVAGTFAYSTYEGTFSGTMTTSVDAYGTLSLNISGLGADTPIEVTRLKTVMNLSLNYLIPNVGTIVQTTYSYFTPNYGFPIFRSTTNDISVPLAGIDQEATTYETFAVELLSTNQTTPAAVGLVRNPVQDMLEVAGQVSHISVMDLNGRVICEAANTHNMDLSALGSGMYLARLTTADNTVICKKFIKR